MALPLWRISRATSTIRMAFFADNAISSTSPIWTWRLLSILSAVSTDTGSINDNGTARTTDIGAYQLSYWPASTR